MNHVPNPRFAVHSVCLLSLLAELCLAGTDITYPAAPKAEVVDTLFGVPVPDPYRPLENHDDPAVRSWLQDQEAISRSFLDARPQRPALTRRLNELRRYDDESAPTEVLLADRIFFKRIKKEWERWAYYTKAGPQAEPVLLLDPNQWGPNTLDLTEPSWDGKYLAYGVSEPGKEDPRISVMEVATRKLLPDSLRGRRQGGIAWRPDNKGFFYTCNPLKGEVPEGEEEYWDAVYYHELGKPAAADRKVFYHDSMKEYFHYAYLSEDGRYVFFSRGVFYKNEVYFRKLDGPDDLIPVTTDLDAQYSVIEIDGRLVIWTDQEAPRGKVMVADVQKPGREHWRELIPESEDKLEYLAAVAGKLYAVYTHNAHTLIRIYTLEGKYLRDLALPTLGSAGVWGYWTKPTAWVHFSSFTYPGSTFKHDADRDELSLYHRPPIGIDSSLYFTEQVWFQSRDGTRVSMFLVHAKGMEKDGNRPVYLTGYGGFNIGQSPYFSSAYVAWLEAGGVVAVPNLRGGGEYGQAWHKAGMLDKKQNVFDDFLAAAEWLIRNKYTNHERLVIGGGSNGGLLMGAAVTQRPDLFAGVYCGVPLLDMIRYHKFGFANIWAEEYGSADKADQFPYLLKYSPYHNVRAGTKYPAVLFLASDNDARCFPLHAMKMAARMQETGDPQSGPILLVVLKASGHGGGTKLSENIDQQADVWSFLMDRAGIQLEDKPTGH